MITNEVQTRRRNKSGESTRCVVLSDHGVLRVKRNVSSSRTRSFPAASGGRITDGLRHLVDCIREGSAPIITPEHGYHVLEIVTRAKEAARDGVHREIDSTFTPPQFDPAGKAIPPHLIHDPTR